jgi:hypothetical protein
MTARRIILLVLLLIPLGFMIVLVGRPASLGDDATNGLEILAMIFSIPIVVLNAWEWQSPNTLDELIPKRKPKTISSADQQAIPFQKKKTILIAAGFILVILLIGCNFIVFSFVGRMVGLGPTSTPEYDIPAIQTAAVQTALAQLGTVEPTESIGLITHTPGAEITELTTLTPGAESIGLLTPTKTPTLAQTTSSAQATPSAQSIGSLGERIEHDGIALTVTKVSITDTLDGSTKAQAGFVYLVIEVTIENVSRAEETPYDPTFFDVTDAGGIQFAPATTAPSPALSAGSLTTGNRVSGNIAFEVYDTTFGFIVSYQPALTTVGNYTPISVDLGQ